MRLEAWLDYLAFLLTACCGGQALGKHARISLTSSIGGSYAGSGRNSLSCARSAAYARVA